MSRQFTKQDAEAKVETWVKTRFARAGIEAGHTGKVVKAELKEEVWGVVIQWDWPRTRHEWFSKDAYEQCIEEVL